MPKPPTSRSLTYVARLARGHTKRSVEVLCEIMNNKDAPMSARIKAAKMLLNRGWTADDMRRPTLDEMLRGHFRVTINDLANQNAHKLPR
jgi:hypothetical protein